jgi:RimJ/RimL family protein N-acetyltransferase
MEISLRDISNSDWDYILGLRNENFKNSFYKQKEPIQKQDHYEYMEKQLSNPDFNHWIATDGKKDLGYIRILNQDISILVQKKFQTKGIGTTMIKLIEEKAISLDIKKLKAVVLPENEKSKKIFLKNNYQQKMNTFEKVLSN